MVRRVKNMPEEEVFTRTLFGIILLVIPFVSGGRWVACVMGMLFLISAAQGVCLTCIFYKKFISKK